MHILEKVGFERLKKTNLTFDNLYTSLEVVKALREKQVSVIGTLRSNRKAVNCKEFWGKKLFLNILKIWFLNQNISDVTGREQYSTEVWFDEETNGDLSLTSYCVPTKSKGSKMVCLLSTYPSLSTTGVSENRNKKSAVVKCYDYTSK